MVRKKLLFILGICMWITVGAGRLCLSAAPTTVVARGAVGPGVRYVQKTLNLVGVPAGPEDGVFGPSTEKAVRVFQARKKIAVDGVVGPSTRAALENEVKAVEKKRAEQRKLEEKRVLLEELKKKTLDARKSAFDSTANQSGAGTIYLTLDDGPDPDTTPRILDILRRSAVPATFFVIGKRAEQHPEILRRMIAEGHSVQNHSYAHDRRPPPLAAQVEDDMARAAKALESITGVAPRCYRPPYGDTSTAVFEAARNQGHIVTLWSNIWGAGIEAVKAAAFDGSIIMLKEEPETVESLPEIIESLRVLGYRFGIIAPAGVGIPTD